MIRMRVIDESLPLPNWTQSAGEELANGISHGIGLVGAMIGTPILRLAAFHHGDISFLIGTIIFTVTMLLVYLGVDALSRLAADACEIPSPSTISRRG
jgi:predicted membrane channel-forming protein YqfA (hemolysin III family)